MKRAAPEPEGGHLQNGVKAQAIDHGYPSETGNSEEVSTLGVTHWKPADTPGGPLREGFRTVPASSVRGNECPCEQLMLASP